MNVNGFDSKAAALRHLKTAGFSMSGLLARPESNPKVAKNGKVDVLTAPLHLAPASLSGFNVCPQASKGCIAACLHTAGNPAYMDGKERSRIAKTKAYMTQRAAFMAVLVFEIAAHRRKAVAAGMECGVRLNATSDLPWERVAVEINGVKIASVMDFFRDVQFYDYTAVAKRAILCAKGDARWPSNYHLTFSKKEDNDAAVASVLQAGGNVTVVMSRERYKAALEAGKALVVGGVWDVTDGDAHDYRPADPKGVLVVLKAKGDARHDQSGFVVR